MRIFLAEKLERGRVRDGHYASDELDGCNGAFEIFGPCQAALRIIASDGKDVRSSEGWEHVSVSIANRCPNWIEMSFVKDLFWRDDECVVQFHPPKAEHINHHPYCLHLWKHVDGHKLPPAILIGPKTKAA